MSHTAPAGLIQLRHLVLEPMLTSADALDSNLATTYAQVRIGGYTKYGPDPGHETRRGISVRTHAQYSTVSEENDVALVLLDRPSTRATIRLPAASTLPAAKFGDSLTAIGWGVVYDGGPSATVLQEASVATRCC